MFLIIDPQQHGVRLGRLHDNTITWRITKIQDRIFSVLKKVMDEASGHALKAIVVCGDASAEVSQKRNVSWSGLRTAVALGNSIAFAKHIPVAMVMVDGDESDRQLIMKIHQAFRGRKLSDPITPAYNGEPHITRPKK